MELAGHERSDVKQSCNEDPTHLIPGGSQWLDHLQVASFVIKTVAPVGRK
jgi:hypothetical protein